MKEYVSPTVELITFSDEKVLTASGCNCQFSGYDEVIDTLNPEYDPDCEAVTGHASENPYGVPAPKWGNLW